MKIFNQELRNTAEHAGVCLWQIAAELGITDSSFSRKLRKELTESEKKRCLDIIELLRTQD